LPETEELSLKNKLLLEPEESVKKEEVTSNASEEDVDVSEEESSEDLSLERDYNVEEEEVDSITVEEKLSVLSKRNSEEKLLVSPDQ